MTPQARIDQLGPRDVIAALFEENQRLRKQVEDLQRDRQSCTCKTPVQFAPCPKCPSGLPMDACYCGDLSIIHNVASLQELEQLIQREDKGKLRRTVGELLKRLGRKAQL